jgi:YfiH family protein
MNLKATFTPRYRSPAIFRSFRELLTAESTRHGGVSLPPFHTLNLGRSTRDNPDHVAVNRRLFWDALQINSDKVASSHQVHGDKVLVTDSPGDFEGYDALVTNTPHVYLAVTIADCTPVLIFDPVQKVIAAAHAGWRGTVSRIAAKTVAQMTFSFGSKPADCHAYVGTCIDATSFEVGNEVAAEFDSTFKTFNKEKNKYYVDLKRANKMQLVESGIPDGQIQVSAYSTVLDNQDYFSYRHENGQTGRMLAVIGMKADDK